jgi:hypothetical protein
MQQLLFPRETALPGTITLTNKSGSKKIKIQSHRAREDRVGVMINI